MKEKPPFDEGASILDGIRLVKLLHGGASAHVYRAIRPDGTTVALKIYTRAISDQADTPERVRREAGVVAKIEHPHLVSVITDGTIPVPFDDPALAQRPFILMAFVEGENLEAQVLREGAWNPIDAAAAIARVADALGILHMHTITHRDIKPANIFLENRTGKLLLGDFGVVAVDSAADVTETGRFLGTRSYAAPEALFGEPDADSRPASDVYSLGATLYFMLHGAEPFPEANQYQQSLRIRNEMPTFSAKNVPRLVKQAILGALQKDPGKRPTLRVFAKLLENALDGASLPMPVGGDLASMAQKIRGQTNAAQILEERTRDRETALARERIHRLVASQLQNLIAACVVAIGPEVTSDRCEVSVYEWANADELVALSLALPWVAESQGGRLFAYMIQLLGGHGAALMHITTGGPQTCLVGIVAGEWLIGELPAMRGGAKRDQRGRLELESLIMFSGTEELITSQLQDAKPHLRQSMLRVFERVNGLDE